MLNLFDSSSFSLKAQAATNLKMDATKENGERADTKDTVIYNTLTAVGTMVDL